MTARLKLETITDLTADLPPDERSRVRILLACQVVRREIRDIRRELGMSCDHANLVTDGAA